MALAKQTMKENKKLSAEQAGTEPKQPLQSIAEETASPHKNILPEMEQSEIPPSTETEILEIKNKETTDMEVHQHSHAHGKKNWKSYFWEFLMLFLAISLSFFVENQREHYIENLRAKEFSKSLVQDLQNDTASLHVQSKTAEIFISITDSLLSLSNKKLEGRNAAQFSFYTRFMYWTAPLSWNRATFEQIKNSGSLRYFKNYQLLEKLMRYNALVNEIEGEYNNHQIRGNMLLKLINEIIDPGYHHDVSKYRLLSLDTMSHATKINFFSSRPAA